MNNLQFVAILVCGVLNSVCLIFLCRAVVCLAKSIQSAQGLSAKQMEGFARDVHY